MKDKEVFGEREGTIFKGAYLGVKPNMRILSRPPSGIVARKEPATKIHATSHRKKSKPSSLVFWCVVVAHSGHKSSNSGILKPVFRSSAPCRESQTRDSSLLGIFVRKVDDER